VAPHLEQSPFKLTFFYPQHLYPDVLQRLQQLLQAAGMAPVVVEGGAGEVWGLCLQVAPAGADAPAASSPTAALLCSLLQQPPALQFTCLYRSTICVPELCAAYLPKTLKQ
jgi:hypothetical protein